MTKNATEQPAWNCLYTPAQPKVRGKGSENTVNLPARSLALKLRDTETGEWWALTGHEQMGSVPERITGTLSVSQYDPLDSLKGLNPFRRHGQISKRLIFLKIVIVTTLQ